MVADFVARSNLGSAALGRPIVPRLCVAREPDRLGSYARGGDARSLVAARLHGRRCFRIATCGILAELVSIENRRFSSSRPRYGACNRAWKCLEAPGSWPRN